jgi:hypothetical protein
MENKKNVEFLKKHEKIPERIPKVPKKSNIFKNNANLENNLSKISTLTTKALYYIPNKLEVELIKHSNKLKSTGNVRTPTKFNSPNRFVQKKEEQPSKF